MSCFSPRPAKQTQPGQDVKKLKDTDTADETREVILLSFLSDVFVTFGCQVAVQHSTILRLVKRIEELGSHVDPTLLEDEVRPPLSSRHAPPLIQSCTRRLLIPS